MPYSTVNVTINGVSTPAIDVSGDQVDVIIEAELSAEDKVVMNTVSDSAGATFADKLAATTLSNGRTADVVYAGSIVKTADKNAQTTAKALSNLVGATLADHEARITTLEP